MGHHHLKWMHQKSSQEDERKAQLKKAKDEILREIEIEELARTGVVKEEHIDWSTENNLSEFTFDVMKMAIVPNLLYQSSTDFRKDSYYTDIDIAQKMTLRKQ